MSESISRYVQISFRFRASLTQCLMSTKKNIAEREVVLCSSEHASARCNDWLRVLRQKAQFSLHIPNQTSILPHSKEMKVQVGGILGLYKLLELEPCEDGSPDIFRALETCADRISSFEDAPFEEIIREVVHFQLR
jgi:hypothetical protein